MLVHVDLGKSLVGQHTYCGIQNVPKGEGEYTKHIIMYMYIELHLPLLSYKWWYNVYYFVLLDTCTS